jgi:hypothetical protein
VANPLTGDFDAVLQIAVPAMNALMAVMHERHAEPITLLHSATVRLDDPGARMAGLASIQFAAPTVSVPAAGARTRVTVHQPVRARYLADAGSAALPAHVHGEAAITIALGHVADRRVGGSLELRFDGAALEDIHFTPGSGAARLDAEQVRQVIAAIRAYVRRALEPVHERLDLAASVRQVDFRTLAHPAHPVLMALASFGRSDLGAGAADGASRVLVDDRNGFALAIGAEYARAQLAAALDGHMSFRTTVGTFTEDITLSDVRLDFVPHVPGTERFGLPPGGFLMLTIRGRAESHLALDIGDFSFTVQQMLVPVVDGAGLRIAAPSDPSLTVDGLGELVVSLSGARATIVAELRRQRDAVLTRINGELAGVVSGAGPGALIERLGVRASVALSGVEVQADGLVIRGRVHAEPAARAVAAFRVRHRPDHVELDALDSWVPGGRVDRFRWRVAGGAPVVESHRFTHAVTLDPDLGFQEVCLEITGSQALASGATRTVSASRCSFVMAGLGLSSALMRSIDLQRFAGGVGLAVQVPRFDASGLAAGVIAHVDLLRVPAAAAFNDTSILVHFASKQPDDERKAIDAWLAQRPAETPAVLLVSVAHEGAAVLPRPSGRSKHVAAAFAFDREAVWAKALGVQARPALVLIARDGEIAWRHEGGIKAETLAAEVDTRLRGSFMMDWRGRPRAGGVGAVAAAVVAAVDRRARPPVRAGGRRGAAAADPRGLRGRCRRRGQGAGARDARRHRRRRPARRDRARLRRVVLADDCGRRRRRARVRDPLRGARSRGRARRLLDSLGERWHSSPILLRRTRP